MIDVNNLRNELSELLDVYERDEKYIASIIRGEQHKECFYEKALDKACEKLVELKDSADCYEFESCPFRNVCTTGTNYCRDKDKWKEYLLKESEKEQW